MSSSNNKNNKKLNVEKKCPIMVSKNIITLFSTEKDMTPAEMFMHNENSRYIATQIWNSVKDKGGNFKEREVYQKVPALMAEYLVQFEKCIQENGTFDEKHPLKILHIMNSQFIRLNYKKFILNKTADVEYNHIHTVVSEDAFRRYRDRGSGAVRGNAIPFYQFTMNHRHYDRDNSEGLRNYEDRGTFTFRYNQEDLDRHTNNHFKSAKVINIPRNEYPVGGMGFMTYHQSPVSYYGNGLDGRQVKPDKINRFGRFG